MSKPSKPMSSSVTILVIDDQETARTFLGRYLEVVEKGAVTLRSLAELLRIGVPVGIQIGRPGIRRPGR